ncbi:MAG: PLP-dependent aminotransferase family protein [Acidobacteriota bacterium]|nr:PLP-dependent aminotransferase family protein [Acidobacteriota bacterium]
MNIRFARRMASVRPSTIREILKVTQQPDIISFAGGLPAPELFPVSEIKVAAERVLTDNGPQALQYGQTEGYLPLRETFAAETRSRGISCAAEDVLITTGSQQSLDLTARVLLDPGDCILTENPTYLAALQAFQSCEVRFAAVPTDEGGLIPEALPELIEREHPKLLYTIPNFQNPTGVTLRRERRQALYEIAARYGLLILEDDPYGKLRYTGEDIPPVKALDTQGLVIYMSTVSKTVAPGLRTGWVVAPEEIAHKIVICKQAADLHSSSLDQRILHAYFRDFDNQAHVNRIRQAYGERYAQMDQCLRDAMPPEFSWTHPEGGMFLWVTCPESVNSSELMPRALQEKVLFVPGRDFFPDGSGTRYMRLNFSNSSPEKIRTGIARLAGVCAATALV